jgi:hypothetical protein
MNDGRLIQWIAISRQTQELPLVDFTEGRLDNGRVTSDNDPP